MEEQPYPTEYPVTVRTTIGQVIENADEAEYLDLRRQGLIKFDEPSASSAEPTARPSGNAETS